MKEEFKELLKQEGITNLENPTETDIKKISELLPILELKNNNELDEILIQEYFKYVAGILPTTLKIINDLASQSLGKDVINSFNKRIDSLNRRYESEKDTEILKSIQEEISDLFDRFERESEKQRNFITKLVYGVLGLVVILGGIAIGIKNKEVGKRIVERGTELIKG